MYQVPFQRGKITPGNRKKKSLKNAFFFWGVVKVIYTITDNEKIKKPVCSLLKYHYFIFIYSLIIFFYKTPVF